MRWASWFVFHRKKNGMFFEWCRPMIERRRTLNIGEIAKKKKFLRDRNPSEEKTSYHQISYNFGYFFKCFFVRHTNNNRPVISRLNNVEIILKKNLFTPRSESSGSWSYLFSLTKFLFFAENMLKFSFPLADNYVHRRPIALLSLAISLRERWGMP